VDLEDPATNKHPKGKVSDYGIWNEIKSKYRDNPICTIKVYQAFLHFSTENAALFTSLFHSVQTIIICFFLKESDLYICNRLNTGIY